MMIFGMLSVKRNSTQVAFNSFSVDFDKRNSCTKNVPIIKRKNLFGKI